MSIQDLRITPNEPPLTGICIVADKTKCPPNYQIIDKTADDGVDADLWKDSLFSVWKVFRYLCTTNQPNPDGLNQVVESIGLINEKDVPPQGFTILEDTVDTKEKATKKKLFVVKMSPRNIVHQAICGIKIFSKQKKTSQSFLYAGELAGLSICFYIGVVPKSNPSDAFGMPPALPYPLGGFNKPPQILAYPINPMDSTQKTNGYQGTMEATWFKSGAQKWPNVSSGNLPSPPDQTSVLSGIPFQISSKFAGLSDNSKMLIQKVQYKSLIDVEREFDYNFHLEKSATAVSD